MLDLFASHSQNQEQIWLADYAPRKLGCSATYWTCLLILCSKISAICVQLSALFNMSCHLWTCSIWKFKFADMDDDLALCHLAERGDAIRCSTESFRICSTSALFYFVHLSDLSMKSEDPLRIRKTPLELVPILKININNWSED